MTPPRPNYRKAWKTCPNCLMAYMGIGEGLCPNCTSLQLIIVSRRVAWGMLAIVVTLGALALTGLWWVVMR